MLAFAAAGCVNEDPGFGESENPGTTGTTGTTGSTETGFLTLSGVHVITDSETDQNTEESPTEAVLSRVDASNPTGLTRGEEATSLDDYRIVITGRKNGVVRDSTYRVLLTEMGDTGLEVPVDIYTITATSNKSGNGHPVIVQSEPSYGGEIESVSVGKEEHKSAGTIVCKLQNIKITLSVAADLYSKLDLLTNLTDEEAKSIHLDKSKLSSGQKIKASVYYGDAESAPEALRWDVPANWDWTKDPAPVYFPALDGDGYNKLQLSFTAKMKDGALIPMVKDITDIMNGQWRRIHVVLTHDTDGNLTFDAQVSSFVQDDTIVVGDPNDPNGVAEIMWKELPYKDPSTFGPSIRWADGTEVPETIVLADGALQNIVLRAPNGIQKVALAYSTTNADMDYSGLLNIDDLCTSKGNPTLKNFGIPYGADLAGQHEAVFELNKLAAQIGPYDGEYTFTFTVIDGKGQPCTRPLKFLAGKVGPTVEGVGFDIDTVQEVSPVEPEEGKEDAPKTDPAEVNVIVHSDAGIDELWVSIISDKLTPMLGEVGIPETFNLCELDLDMEGTMSGFGFPCNEEVKGKQELDFRISAELMPLLVGFPGDHEFQLRVVDANGEITKSIRLHVKE